MSEWLTYREKSLLFSALAREKKVCAEADKECYIEHCEKSLVSVIESLEDKFYHDRLFEQIEKQIKADAIKELREELIESELVTFSQVVDFLSGKLEQLKKNREEIF